MGTTMAETTRYPGAAFTRDRVSRDGDPQAGPGTVKPVRRGAEIKDLKTRDNQTNFAYLARVYLIIAATLAATIWSYGWVAAAGLGWWWNTPATIISIFVIGASQHQFGGVIHEGTHYILFADRELNERVSDWLAAFPIYTSTFHFRLHHLAHHQFINDPERDPDFAQLKDSGHWLDFPVTHIEMAWALLRQLWLPNLIRYTITRARYSALGAVRNPYVDPERTGARAPTLVLILFAAGLPPVITSLIAFGHGVAALVAWGLATTAGVLYFTRLDDDQFPKTRLEPVISHKVTSIGRLLYLSLLYGALSAIEVAGFGPAWNYFGLLWIVPLFTTFPLFMIMRQWVQHGNADRGRLTNTRVFLVNPVLRYAIFPFGMDYHLPHHIYASVPHYKLPELHDLLLKDPEYAEKGVVVEGYFHPPHDVHHEHRNPTVLEVLSAVWAPKRHEENFVDSEAIADAVVSDRAAIAREEALSQQAG